MKKDNVLTLKISHLYKNYGTIEAANDINLKTKQGDIIALLGPNGAGKSTLMNIIAGYLTADRGNISVLGKDIFDSPLFAKENIGFLAEGAPLYADLSVQRFLQYMAELRGLKKDAVELVAATANITDVLKQKIETLSKGYQRRVGFAQSILANPPILLLDEPTDGLDPNQKDSMRQLIKKMAPQKTIIISTHLLEEAESVCNRIVILAKGKIKADGNMKTILKQTRSQTLAQAFAALTTTEDANA